MKYPPFKFYILRQKCCFEVQSEQQIILRVSILEIRVGKLPRPLRSSYCTTWVRSSTLRKYVRTLFSYVLLHSICRLRNTGDKRTR